MTDEVEDLRADISLARDELKAALKVQRLHSEAILELHTLIKTQGKILIALLRGPE